jgi:pyruvate kinase
MEAVVVISDEELLTNSVAAQRLLSPIFAFTGNEKLALQLNLVWNVTPIYEKNIGNDSEKNLDIADKFMKEHGFTKYLAVFDVKARGKKAASYPTVQIRDLLHV